MITVSINAFNDADLLENCLETVREHVPDARIQVVDGRYETHPAPTDNSTDATPDLADAYGAEYFADGPFKSERSKHLHRRALAPTGERLLFIDADERLLAFDPECVPEDTVARVRIFNAKIYGNQVRYYPRYFYPDQLESVVRVDRFSFDAPVRRTDAITVNHRADLRGEAYRAAKVERYDAEGRDNWYREHLESLAENGFSGVEFHECPECGRDSLTRSRVTNYGDYLDDCTRVAVCTAGECYAAVEPYDVGAFRYVPDRLEAGFADDPDRVRVELAVAGWNVARVMPTSNFEGWEANAGVWVDEEYAPRID